MANSPDDICSKCQRPRSFVQHCRECCGWGMTKDIKYHKFVAAPRRKTAARRKSR